jgi:hypothetical protein
MSAALTLVPPTAGQRVRDGVRILRGYGLSAMAASAPHVCIAVVSIGGKYLVTPTEDGLQVDWKPNDPDATNPGAQREHIGTATTNARAAGLIRQHRNTRGPS